MAGIDGAQDYADRIARDGVCPVCGNEFRMVRGAQIGKGAVAIRGVGVVEYCSDPCLETLKKQDPSINFTPRGRP